VSTPQRQNQSVLIIDDNDFLTPTWAKHLRGVGHTVAVVPTLQAAREILKNWDRQPFSCVLLDLKLPDGDGEELLPVLEALSPLPQVAVVTAHLDYDRALDLFGRCALAIPKPESRESIVRVVAMLAELRASKRRHELAVASFAERHNLSEREAAVVNVLVANAQQPSTSDAMGLSRTTIKTYLARIYTKTGLRSQDDVVREVIKLYDEVDRSSGGDES
jgi:FixJ family two-component response regulator